MFHQRKSPDLALYCALLTAVFLISACAPATSIPINGTPQDKAPAQSGSQKPKGGGQAPQQAKGPRQDTAGSKQVPAQKSPVIFSGVNFLLGSPTDSSIIISVLSDKDRQAFIEFGEAADGYAGKTATASLSGGVPAEIKLTSLQPDTQYYYRVNCKMPSEAGFTSGKQYAFHTRRDPGSSFTFTLQADPHRDENTSDEIYRATLANTLAEKPDFHIDLGDTFMGDKWAKNYQDLAARYIEERSLFSLLCQSAPLFLVNGNHEGENGWKFKGVENSLPVWAANCRKLYYPNPEPGAFYSGGSDEAPYTGQRQSYYSWQWGDALFVVLDPYWYTLAAKSPAGWDWTLGKEQYDWLKGTLESSQARFKFVFSHNLAGGFDMANAGNGRGGSEAARYYEWGGLNADGTQGFDQNRPGWGKPIHQLLVDNGVTIFFHGHDHFFARQELDGVIYQECPQPGAVSNNDHAGEYGYKEGVFLGGPGHVRVSVSGSAVTVDFIRTYLPGAEPAGHKNGESAYSYTVNAGGTGQ